MTNERSLTVIVDVAIGDGDIVSSMSEIGQTIIVILIVASVGRHIDMIDPDVGGLLDTNSVAIGS
jgi:hypothetical protein